jgi:hypothetical protein
MPRQVFSHEDHNLVGLEQWCCFYSNYSVLGSYYDHTSLCFHRKVVNSLLLDTVVITWGTDRIMTLHDISLDYCSILLIGQMEI